jgi:hypothetical protein
MLPKRLIHSLDHGVFIDLQYRSSPDTNGVYYLCRGVNKTQIYYCLLEKTIAHYAGILKPMISSARCVGFIVFWYSSLTLT